MLRGRRTLIVLAVAAALAGAAILAVRWVLRPDNVARMIAAWSGRQLGATLTLAESPGVRLLPRLQRSEEHTSELQSRENLVCRLLLEKKNDPPGLPLRCAAPPHD